MNKRAIGLWRRLIGLLHRFFFKLSPYEMNLRPTFRKFRERQLRYLRGYPIKFTTTKKEDE